MHLKGSSNPQQTLLRQCHLTSKEPLSQIQVIHILNMVIPKFLSYVSPLRSLYCYMCGKTENNWYSLTWLPCSLCWRENEALSDFHIILGPTFIKRTTKSSWRRIWLPSSSGWSDNSLQRRCILKPHFSNLDWMGYKSHLEFEID